MGETWYELYDSNDGKAICYLRDKDFILDLKKHYLRFSKIRELNHRPAQLEFIVKDGENLMGSFEFEGGAMKYNLEKLKSGGEICLNPQEDQLKLYL